MPKVSIPECGSGIASEGFRSMERLLQATIWLLLPREAGQHRGAQTISASTSAYYPGFLSWEITVTATTKAS